DEEITWNFETMLCEEKELIEDLGRKVEESMDLEIGMGEEIGDLKDDKEKLEEIVEKGNEDLNGVFVVG
ncbi:hypothetical protein, partial [Bacillus thuringiensis]|uniref:hypothetical protein n=1 Tax=Bacillus thuringiensis TaxID=1428 RepID=UPI0016433732